MMLTKLEVMDKPAFDAWYASGKLSPHDTEEPKGKGEELYKTLGCVSCHSLDGSESVGPSFKGMYGAKIKVLTEGKLREVIADDDYIRTSVRTPDKDVVQGFQNGIMPNLSDQIDTDQMESLIEFIKQQNDTTPLTAHEELKPAAKEPAKTEPQAVAPSKPDGATLFKTKSCVACHSLDGTKKIGPSFKGIYGSVRKVLTDGKEREVKADETYLHTSIHDPNADVVEGFPPNIMPPFGKMLTQEEIDALVNYIKEIK